MTDKEELIEQLKFMIETLPEELYRIVIDAIQLFLESTIKFGKSSNQAQECLNVIREMSNILKEERHLLKLILDNINNVDIDEAWDTVDTLDKLNEKTYLSYDDILLQVEVSIQIDNPQRALRPNKGIDSLITNDEYKQQVLSLIQKKKDQ